MGRLGTWRVARGSVIVTLDDISAAVVARCLASEAFAAALPGNGHQFVQLRVTVDGVELARCYTDDEDLGEAGAMLPTPAESKHETN